MRAAWIRAPREAVIDERQVPAPAPDQVLVRIEGCGVCGSDLPVWQGRPWLAYPREPGSPGHEAWGVVERAGGAVTGLRAGDRVAGLLFRAYADFELAEADRLVRLPPAIDGMPFPGDPLGRAMNVFERSGIAEGATVAVVGIGFLGGLLVQLAARAGAHVIAFGRRPCSLDVAGAFGAEETVAPRSDALSRVIDFTDGDLCDVVIEAAGVQETLDLAGACAREGGRLVIAGYHQDGPRTVDLQLWNRRGLDVVNAHSRGSASYRRGLERAIAAVGGGELDPAPLYTHQFPLERVGDALRALETRPSGFMKALVTRA